MNQNDTFTYWKKPWHKWITFIAAVLQTIALSLEIRDFREIGRAGIRDKLFSPTGWESYVAEQYFHFAISISLICMFFGIFFIGLFARSKKAAGISEGILLLSIGLLLGIVGVVLPVFQTRQIRSCGFFYSSYCFAAAYGRSGRIEDDAHMAQRALFT